MASFYSNENFPLPVVTHLRELGHDVLTSHEAGNSNQKIPDDQVLAFATGQNRTVLTLNRRDFRKLHRSNPTHAGIVTCTADLDYVGQAERISVAIAKHETLTGQLLKVYRPS